MLLKRMAKTVLPDRTLQYLKASTGKRIAAKLLTEKLARGEDVRLEIGSGAVKGRNGMVTVDLSGADLPWDLSLPLPFPENSISFIYSSHVMEHFFYNDLMRLLRDCLRVLKPGTTFSSCVPDASIYLRAYADQVPLDSTYLQHTASVISNTGIDVVNYIAYMSGHHRYMFDAENLVKTVSVAGFTAVRIRDFDPSIDLPERRHGSIYVHGVKP
jgi:predicted SAM-dependent methyltransferase